MAVCAKSLVLGILGSGVGNAWRVDEVFTSIPKVLPLAAPSRCHARGAAPHRCRARAQGRSLPALLLQVLDGRPQCARRNDVEFSLLFPAMVSMFFRLSAQVRVYASPMAIAPEAGNWSARKWRTRGCWTAPPGSGWPVPRERWALRQHCGRAVCGPGVPRATEATAGPCTSSPWLLLPAVIRGGPWGVGTEVRAGGSVRGLLAGRGHRVRPGSQPKGA